MLNRYIKAAMNHATYQQSADGQPYHGEIAELPGLHAQAASQDACRAELRGQLRWWLQLRLCRQLPIPAIDGIPLVAWMQLERSV